VVTDLFGKSGRLMMHALVAGERAPTALAELACGTLRGKKETLVLALRGGFTEHHAFMLKQLLRMVDDLTDRIDELTARIEDGCRSNPGSKVHEQAVSSAQQASDVGRPLKGSAPSLV
jgi:hypothetical protein